MHEKHEIHEKGTFIMAVSAILQGNESPEEIQSFEQKITENFASARDGLKLLFYHKNIPNDLRVKGGFNSFFFEKSDERFKFPVSKNGVVVTQGKYYKRLSDLKKAMLNDFTEVK